MMRTKQRSATGIKVAVLLCVLAALGACTNTARFGGEPETAAAPPPSPAPAPAPEPAPAQPPPVDLAGKWKLSGAGGACLMTLTDEPGSTDGKIAPAGGCPGNFFMSRKWSYQHDALTIRDFKGQALAELSFAGGHFEGRASGGGVMTLARP
jgi:Protease inhibitor Inh